MVSELLPAFYGNTLKSLKHYIFILIQDGNQIFYESCKDIPQGTELLVWYGDCYLQFMGIPVALKDMGEMVTGEEQGNYKI